jgi:predicted dehydrogenase
LNAVADDWNVAGRYRSHDAMLADADLDVVDICSPPQFHLEQAVAAFEDGSDVLMEKPMVASIEEASNW